MAQHEATYVDHFNTTEGDRVFRWDVAGKFMVAFIYDGQHSPQFIACDTQGEADDLFRAARTNAAKRGELREVAHWQSGE
ncbi:hypothetical protein ACIRP5_10080 [Streptomyces sp. NPDC101221]|uniref:hypothetical protein n=1 Tax=Streptomyces sp. NPDC101221 TaxID=3366132 RepID=UPI0037F4FD40